MLCSSGTAFQSFANTSSRCCTFWLYSLSGIAYSLLYRSEETEKKQEELRQLVGERYRDLIDAADSIVSMKHTSDKLAAELTALQAMSDSKKLANDWTKRLNATHDPHREVLRKNLYPTAAQMKLLVDAPEQVYLGLGEIGVYAVDLVRHGT